MTWSLQGDTHQGLQLLAVDEVHLRDEVIEVFVAGVDVGLCTHHDDPVEVVDVDVHEDPEEAAQDLLADLEEVLWEGDTWRRQKRENKTMTGKLRQPRDQAEGPGPPGRLQRRRRPDPA